jgi:hypothetical protein
LYKLVLLEIVNGLEVFGDRRFRFADAVRKNFWYPPSTRRVISPFKMADGSAGAPAAEPHIAVGWST